jgi:hypothetical protein
MSVSSIEPESLPVAPGKLAIHRWLYRFFILFVAILVIAGVVLAVYSLRQHQRHTTAVAEIEAEIARLRAAGEPLTPEEMQEFHRVPAGVADTTRLWLAAVMPLAETHDADRAILSDQGEYELSKLRASGPENWLARAEEFLQSRQEVVRGAVAAANAKGEVRFPIDFSQGLNARLEHVAPASRLTHLLRLRHRVALARGNRDAAIESIRLMWALQDALRHEPTSVGQCIRLVSFMRAQRELQRLIGFVDLSEPELADLQAKLELIEFGNGARIGLLGERVMGYHAFLHDMKVTGENGESEFNFGSRRQFPRRAVGCAYYLSQMREQIDATANSFGEGWLCNIRIHNRLVSIEEHGYWWQREEVALSRELLGSNLHTFLASAQALRDSAISGIAARRYQLRHGEPPAGLADLVPEYLKAVPSDPFLFHGQPLEFVRQGNRIAIFSVGDDQESDLALFQGGDTEDDIGFLLVVKTLRFNATP